MKYWSNFIKDENRKNLISVTGELIRLALYKKEIPIHYFTRFLYRKGISMDDMLVYMTNREVARFHKALIDQCMLPLLDNKLFFYYHFRGRGIDMPETLGYNISNTIFSGDNVLTFSDLNELKCILMNILSESGYEGIFIKPADGFWGWGAYKLNQGSIENLTDKFYNDFVSRNFIIQECVCQHEVVNAVYGKSLNTIRMDTYIDRLGNVDILTAAMRFGKGSNYVDNASSGGIFVPLDLTSGTLGRHGYTLLKTEGKIYDSHPDTHMDFFNYRIPYIEEAKELLIRAAKLTPCFKVVGWDVAISKSGPVLIEGNTDYHIGFTEIANGPYKNNPVYKKIVSENGGLV